MAPEDLSELQRAQAALVVSERRLSLVLAGSNDGWWDWDLTLNELFYSPRWWAILGYEPDALPADAALWERLLHPEDRPEVERVFGAALAHGPDRYELEFRLQHRDGHYVPVLTRGHILRDDAGRPTRVSGTNMDLTTRKRIQQAQRESDASHRLLLEAMTDGVFIAQGHSFVLANPALPALLGYSLERFIGLPFDAVVAPEFLAMWTQRFDARIADGEEPPPQYELCFLRRGGERLWVELRASRMVYRGEPAVLGVVRDASDRQRAEAEYRIRTLNQRLALAIRGAGYGVWEFVLATHTLIWDDQMHAIHGLARESFDGTRTAVKVNVHPEDLAIVEARFNDMMVGRRVDLFEFRIRRPSDGQLRHIEGSGYLQRDSEGRAQRLVGMNRDITESKQAEATRQQLETRLLAGQKLEAIGTLAGGVAHDFNNLLAAILGNLALARQDVGAQHPALESLDQIQIAGLRARNLVQQILAFSRRQPQQLIVQPLRPIVEEALALLRSTLPAAVALEARLGVTPLPVRTDATQMQQVVMNLCTNAWHAMQGQPGRIVVGLGVLEAVALGSAGLPPGRYAHLWIADDGAGMDEACLARIFEPFFTTKPVGQGTGLGLSVVHGIVTAQGGVIAVQSEPGRGSRFDLHFPLATPLVTSLATADDGPRTGPVAGVAPPPGRGQCIVYVDDDELMLVTVERLLQRAGYAVRCFQDAREALVAVAADPGAVDLVVSDYNMPVWSGLDLARALTELAAPPPVVISSGYLVPELRSEARALGVRALLKKEHTVEELEALVQRVLAEPRG